MLVNEFPEHKWLPWKFTKVPNGWWQKLGSDLLKADPSALDIVTQYIKDLEQQYSIDKPQDWYNVSIDKMKPGTKLALRKLHGLHHVLSKVYPQHAWDKRKLLKSFGRPKLAEQHHISKKVATLLKK